MSLDSLLEVKARFFDVGDEIDLNAEIDQHELCSYGEFDGDHCVDYVSGIPSDEDIEKIDQERKGERERTQGVFMREIEYPKSTVTKDFVVFDINVISLNNNELENECGVYWEIDAMGMDSTFEPFMDVLVSYAKEVRQEVIDRRSAEWDRKYFGLREDLKPTKDDPKVYGVSFLLLAEYECHRCSYEYEEYDCEIDIVGRVTRQDFNEMLYDIGKREKKASCPICGKMGCAPHEHAGWKPK